MPALYPTLIVVLDNNMIAPHMLRRCFHGLRLAPPCLHPTEFVAPNCPGDRTEGSDSNTHTFSNTCPLVSASGWQGLLRARERMEEEEQLCESSREGEERRTRSAPSVSPPLCLTPPPQSLTPSCLHRCHTHAETFYRMRTACMCACACACARLCEYTYCSVRCVCVCVCMCICMVVCMHVLLSEVCVCVCVCVCEH